MLQTVHYLKKFSKEKSNKVCLSSYTVSFGDVTGRTFGTAQASATVTLLFAHVPNAANNRHVNKILQYSCGTVGNINAKLSS